MQFFKSTFNISICKAKFTSQPKSKTNPMLAMTTPRPSINQMFASDYKQMKGPMKRVTNNNDSGKLIVKIKINFSLFHEFNASFFLDILDIWLLSFVLSNLIFRNCNLLKRITIQKRFHEVNTVNNNSFIWFYKLFNKSYSFHHLSS